VADAQPDYSGSCMIALYPPPEVAGALAVPDGLSAEGMHLTIAYTGDAADVDPEALNAVARALAGRPPVAAVISGHARFTGGEQDVIVALVDSPDLETLRADAREALGAAGIAIPSEHGFTPHMSIRYCAADDVDPVGRLASFPVAFGAVSAVHGKARTDYLFDDPLPGQAREAYAAGWALSGGPMTDRVKAGCTAAIARALENRHDPAVLEVTLDLGKLQGTWAEVYRRREELTAGHVDLIAAAWRKLVKRLDVHDLVKQWKRHASLPAPMESADQQWRKAAVVAVLAWLRSVLADPDYRELAQAVTAALTAGQAEGRTAALAVAADQAGAVGFDWDKAYDAMTRDVAVHLPDAAEPWVQRIIAGAAADGGKLLADLADEGESDTAIAKAVLDVIAGTTPKALTLIADYAMGAAMARGSLDLYASEGLTLVAWMTAGDGRVCPACQDNEDNGPYAPEAFPSCPDHYRCRCCPAPAQPLPVSAYAAFLVPAA
jgi:2'-5' RNA ligase